MCIDFWFRAALRVSHPDSPDPIRSLKRDVSASNRYSPETKCNVSLLVFVKRIFIQKLIVYMICHLERLNKLFQKTHDNTYGQIWPIINLCMPISCLLLIPILCRLSFAICSYCSFLSQLLCALSSGGRWLRSHAIG